ncbi:MAG: alpha/beta fold hydrolase [Methylococcales bacterium]
MKTVELNAKISGDSHNPPLIIMHGLFGSSRNWSQLADKFAEDYQVYVVDLRNHGESPHVQGMDYPAMAADLSALMTAHKIQNATVLGHSLGGKVAMWLALTQPDCVRRLIVIDIAPVHYAHDFNEIFRGIQSVPLQTIVSRGQVDSYLAKHISEPAIRQFLLQNLVNREGQYTWRIPFNFLEQAILEIMGFPETSHIKPCIQPALFIAGGRSDYLLVKHHETINSLFPNHTIKTIENAGHWVHAEQPQQVFDVVHQFCTEPANLIE